MQKKIYVYEERENKEKYMIAEYSLDNLSEGRDGCKVGVYELKEVRTLKVTKELK